MSRAARVTRRGLLAGAAALGLAAAVPALGRPFPRGGIPSGSAATSYTLTFANTAGTATPTDVPIRAMQWFVRGDVPAGQIAVPQVSGVDQVYQADNRVYWDDGSLMGAKFRIARTGAMTAGASQTITWNIRTGSYSNTSSITTADVTGETDYRASLSNVHTVAVDVGNQRMLALAINNGTGQISGGRVIFPANMTQGTTNVTGGGGTGGQISVSGGVLTVVTPGSGYAYTGSGSFEIALNSIIASINSVGNRTGGRRIEQYAKGPVCDAWRVTTTVSGMSHFHVSFYIERWKKADGSLLSYRLMVMPANGHVDFTNSWPCYTYDLDIKNGASTVIRGASLGDTGYTTILHTCGAAFLSADINGHPYWSANSAAYNAIIPQRTPAECLVFRATGVPLPWLLVNTTTTVPTTPSAYEVSSNGGHDFLCQYVPMGNAGIRSALGTGGEGWNETPMDGPDGEYFLGLYNSRTSDARTWLNNMRIAAANHLTFGQLGAPLIEPTTCYLPNSAPSAVSGSFAGMVPARETHSVFDIPVTGFANPMPNGGVLSTVGQVYAITYHQTCATFGYYITAGEQWTADTLMFASLGAKFGKSPGSGRQITLGSTTYYGVTANVPFNERNAAWDDRTEIYTLAVRPTAWADGTVDQERAAVDYMLNNTMSYRNALVPWLGTVKFGSGGATVTKTIDFTNSGIWPEDFDPAATSQASETLVMYMDSYMLMCHAHGSWLLQGTTTGNAIRTWTQYNKIALVRLFQDTSQPHFMKIAYRLMVQKKRPPSSPADINYGPLDPSNPGNSIAVLPFGFGVTGPNGLLTFANGSLNITLNAAMKFREPSTVLANGTRVRLTSTNVQSSTAGTAPPSPFDETTWYYLLYNGGNTTIQLCTGLDGGGNPDPATAVTCGASGASNVFFWVIPSNTLPSDTSGAGWYEAGSSPPNVDPNGRVSQYLGTVRILRAMGFADEAGASLSGAEASLVNLFNATSQDYTAGVQYGFDNNMTA